ncbi:MAG: hypothetical protein RMI32_01755 [Candidatus Nitrosocaldus sp.]|nr:hypothetical protein [Candidatus Nitrosocaldus sp.]
MMRGTLVIVAVLMVTVAIVIALISTSIRATQAVDEELRELSENPCIPDALEIAQKNMPFGIKIRTPTDLPEGYRLAGITGVLEPGGSPGGWIDLYYWDRDGCALTSGIDSHALIMQYKAVKVTILVPRSPEGDYKDGDDFAKQYYSYYLSRKDEFRADVRLVELSNGYKGYGNDPFMGTGKWIRIEEGDGSERVVHEEPYPEPGRIAFFHEEDKTVYIVRADMPLEGLMRIAESIK